MTTENICILVTIALYLAMMVGIGLRFSKKTNTSDDFYLGGRKLGPLVTAMSAEASDMSGWLLMGLPGVAYLYGISDAGWTAIGLGIGTYLNWLLVAKRIRLYSHHIDAITIPEFFAKRFHDSAHILTGISAAVILIFFIPYTASGFAACGKLFNSIFGINYMTAMIVSAIVIVAYTALGGFLAASTTDFIQSIVMSIAMIVMVFFGISVAGGLDVVMDNANQLVGYLSMIEIHDPTTLTSSAYGPITIVSTMAWGLGYFGMPHILLRFMAIEDENKLALSRRVASVWVVIAMFVAIFIGIIGYSVSKVGAIAVLEGSDSETIVVKLAGLLSTYGVFPALIAGVVVAGILACTMSTSDSQLLTAASGVSENLLSECFGVKMTEKQQLMAARATVLVIAVVAMFLASDPNSSVFDIVSFAWAGFGATFGPVMLMSLFWKRCNKEGAIAGLVAGGIMVFAWKYMVRPMGGVWNIYELLPAFIVAFVAIVVVSLATAAPSAEIKAEFDAVSKM
ncbi:sodium/proline symporter [Bengtsoniella intestinalis]|uniref:sodium/proline symporter n=1 Tax=Bengtsoniella intestinalis TaxID=3073143 RepID=UPI00391F5707